MPDGAHYLAVAIRAAAAAYLALSVALHVGAAALVLFPRHPAEKELDPPPAAAGDTFELPAPDTAVVPLANASPSPETASDPAAEDGDGPARPAPPRRAASGAKPSHAGRPSGGRAEPAHGDSGGSGSAAQYGAVGERSASDLATAFTRAFPQAASADPAWRSAGFGSAGEADVVLTLGPTGHLENSQVLGAPSPALASGVRRTLALIQARPFVARGAVTRLHVVASVSPDTVHDGLHGDVFAIGGSYAGGEGSAFFALAIGRRVDLRVRAR